MRTSSGAAAKFFPQTGAVADDVVVLDSVDSTNAFARQSLLTGALGAGLASRQAGSFMAVIAAEEQTGGCGRLARRWVSHRGESFTVSFIGSLPAEVVTDASVNGWLPMIAGLAALDALRGVFGEFGISPIGDDRGLSLKWPNDIYCDGLKLGGILTELVMPGGPGAGRDGSAHGDALPVHADQAFVIFGIGMNLGLHPEQLPTPQSTSLQLHARPLPPFELLRDGLAAKLAVALRRRLGEFARDPRERGSELLDEVSGVCWTLGRSVRAQIVGGDVVEGRAVSLNADASLTIEDAAGESHVVHTGDVGVLA